MTLEPDQYERPDHHTDLTGQLEQALSEQGPPVAYPRPSRPRRFQEIVTCPGTTSAGPHPLTCTGSHTP